MVATIFPIPAHLAARAAFRSPVAARAVFFS
jgi:hypothetical protein